MLNTTYLHFLLSCLDLLRYLGAKTCLVLCFLDSKKSCIKFSFNILMHFHFQVFKCSDGIVFAHKIILITACPLIAKAVEQGNLSNEELVQVTHLFNLAIGYFF